METSENLRRKRDADMAARRRFCRQPEEDTTKEWDFSERKGTGG